MTNPILKAHLEGKEKFTETFDDRLKEAYELATFVGFKNLKQYHLYVIRMYAYGKITIEDLRRELVTPFP